MSQSNDAEQLHSTGYLINLLEQVVEEVRMVDLGIELYTRIQQVLDLKQQAERLE